MIHNPALNVTVGKFILTTDGAPIQTTLGSCVSVIFYFAGDILAASMSHYLLDRKPDEIDVRDPDAMRYGDILIRAQLKKMLEFGPQAGLRAMIFGGALPHNHHHSSLISSIGSNNIKVAHEILNKEMIPIVASDTGEKEARHVEFDPKLKKAKERLIVEEITRYFP